MMIYIWASSVMLSGLVVLPFTVDHHLLQTHAGMKDNVHCDNEEKAASRMDMRVFEVYFSSLSLFKLFNK